MADTEALLLSIMEMMAARQSKWTHPNEIQSQLIVSFSVVAVPNGSSIQIIGSDPNRVTLLLAFPGTGIVVVGPTAAILATAGVPLNTQAGWLDMNISDHGALVQQAWFGFGTAVGQSVSIFSQTWKPSGSDE